MKKIIKYKFSFDADSIWCKNGRLLFTVTKHVASDPDFILSYPPVTHISITFKNKKGDDVLTGDASVISGYRFNILKDLRLEYEKIYCRKKCCFVFYENSPKKWIAIEK